MRYTREMLMSRSSSELADILNNEACSEGLFFNFKQFDFDCSRREASEKPKGVRLSLSGGGGGFSVSEFAISEGESEMAKREFVCSTILHMQEKGLIK